MTNGVSADIIQCHTDGFKEVLLQYQEMVGMIVCSLEAKCSQATISVVEHISRPGDHTLHPGHVKVFT